MQFTVVSGTNRPGNLSLLLAETCKGILNEHGLSAELLDLQMLPREIAFEHLENAHSEGFAPCQTLVDRSTHFVFVVPEYNGSMPGILKVFIDACDYPDSFRGKSAVLVGLAAGSGGNRRGLVHLRDVLEYFGMKVHPEQVTLAHIRKMLLPNGGFADKDAEQELRTLLGSYLEAHSG